MLLGPSIGAHTVNGTAVNIVIPRNTVREKRKWNPNSPGGLWRCHPCPTLPLPMGADFSPHSLLPPPIVIPTGTEGSALPHVGARYIVPLLASIFSSETPGC